LTTVKLSGRPTSVVDRQRNHAKRKRSHHIPSGFSSVVTCTSFGILAAQSTGRKRASTARCSLAERGSVDEHAASVQPLALHRSIEPSDDVIIARYRTPGSVDTEYVELQRGVSNCWVGRTGKTGEMVELGMDDVELAVSLLHSPDDGEDIINPSNYSTGWPPSILESLHPWRLSGCGTVVFDGKYFLEHLEQLLQPGHGPVLFPQGLAKLGLQDENARSALQQALSSERRALSLLAGGVEGSAGKGASYEALLSASEAACSGYVDLTRSRSDAGSRRVLSLSDWPFGFAYAPRTWRHGAVIRELEPGGTAEAAGCRLGDVIITANDMPVINENLTNVAARINSASTLVLEVEQPLLEGPFYLREASLKVLSELAGPDAENCARNLVPKLSDLIREGGNNQRVSEVQDVPKVFFGEAGSASHLHADNVPRLQFCHVLQGIKLFVVEHNSATAASQALSGNSEITFPADLPMAPEIESWLCGNGVSLAACHAGDIFCFWGGDRHCGVNAAGSTHCLALYHGYHWDGHSTE